MKRALMIASTTFALSLCLGNSCEDDNAGEVGEDTEETMDGIGDETEDAIEDSGDEIEDATD